MITWNEEKKRRKGNLYNDANLKGTNKAVKVCKKMKLLHDKDYRKILLKENLDLQQRKA